MKIGTINALNKFKIGVKGTFKKHIDNHNKLDPNNSKIFEDAVSAAYGDAKRTFKGIAGRASTANSNLASKIQTYFQKSAPNNPTYFDKLHNTWCTEFISDLQISGYTTTTYGQAQKVVNMTFKYLYCLDDAIATYDKHFEFCHVALDSFTLEWIWRNCNFSDTESHDDWSKIQYNDRSTKKSTTLGYKNIVDKYRKNKPTNYPDTPFQSEFIFWEEIKYHIAAEEFYFSLYGDISKDNFKKMSLSQKYSEIKKII